LFWSFHRLVVVSHFSFVLDMSEKEYDFEQAEQGAVMEPLPGKTRITIRIDNDVLNWFRQQVHEAGGGSYQTLINEALREYIQYRDEMLESVLRKVIRDVR
jgi:uncharacterized protein (DUF4415 family)